MRLQRRISKLEENSPSKEEWPISLVYFGSKLGAATIVNSGMLIRDEQESEVAFIRRATATRIARSPLGDLTDEEIKRAFAAADLEIAAEKASSHLDRHKAPTPENQP